MKDQKQRNVLSGSRRDYCGGALILLIGLLVVVQGASYHVGSLDHMGAGFFPVAVGVILSLLGIAIAGAAWKIRRRATAKEKLTPEWRGWICIVLSVVTFVVLGRYGGLLPATFAIVFISAMGDRQNTVKSAGILAVAISAVCVAIFWWALQLQFPLFRWN